MVCRQAGYLQRVIPYTGSSLNRVLAVLAIYFTMDVLAIECLVGGTAANQRTSNKCESAGGSEAGSVPISDICKARDSSEEVTNAGCKKPVPTRQEIKPAVSVKGISISCIRAGAIQRLMPSNRNCALRLRRECAQGLPPDTSLRQERLILSSP